MDFQWIAAAAFVNLVPFLKTEMEQAFIFQHGPSSIFATEWRYLLFCL